MKYQELELVAACAVGTTAATMCALFEYIYGYGIIEIGFSAMCLFVIGAGTFVAIADRVSDDRERRERRRHRMKQVDFRVGRVIPGSEYVEVKN